MALLDIKAEAETTKIHISIDFFMVLHLHILAYNHIKLVKNS